MFGSRCEELQPVIIFKKCIKMQVEVVEAVLAGLFF